MNEERVPSAIDWKDLLLIVLLCFIIFLILFLGIEWAAQRWSLGWLTERGSRGSFASVLAVMGGSWLGFRVADALGFKPIKRPEQP